MSHSANLGQRRGEEKPPPQLTCAREGVPSQPCVSLLPLLTRRGQAPWGWKEKKVYLRPNLLEEFDMFASGRYREAVWPPCHP